MEGGWRERDRLRDRQREKVRKRERWLGNHREKEGESDGWRPTER